VAPLLLQRNYPISVFDVPGNSVSSLPLTSRAFDGNNSKTYIRVQYKTQIACTELSFSQVDGLRVPPHPKSFYPGPQ